MKEPFDLPSPQWVTTHRLRITAVERDRDRVYFGSISRDEVRPSRGGLEQVQKQLSHYVHRQEAEKAKCC